jgi:lipoate---protein ligase
MPPQSPPRADPDRPSLFDVEQFRPLTQRYAVARRADHPTLVLGSTQRSELVRTPYASEIGTEVVRRRGGGGAVLLRPGDHLWIDAWIPRDDPLWRADVGDASLWVGAWWNAAFRRSGIDRCSVHRGRALPGDHGALVCFSGRGPGEVFHDDRKVMGVSQWRSREGSLFHTCAYSHWEPRPLAELLEGDPSAREALVGDLAGSAIGFDEVAPDGGPRAGALESQLLSSFPNWGDDGLNRHRL